MYTHINKNNPIPDLRPNHHKHTNTNEYKHKLIGTHRCSNQMRCGFLFLGINLCMYENGGVGLKKKERKKKKMSLVISGSDLTTHKSWAPQSHLIYALATEFQFSSFENSWNLFSLSITYIHFFESLRHENSHSKLLQIDAHSWVPFSLDDGSWKLIDITQFSSHPNKL